MTSMMSCTSQKTVLLVHTGHDVEHQGPEDNEGVQREVHRDQEDQPRRLTHKLVATVEPSTALKKSRSRIDLRIHNPPNHVAYEILRRLTHRMYPLSNQANTEKEQVESRPEDP